MYIDYRYSNGRIYMQPMARRESDKVNILAARKDWRADGVDGSADGEWDYFFEQWLSEGEEAQRKATGFTNPTKEQAAAVGLATADNSITSRSFYPDAFYLTETIHEVGTDNFVGFTRCWLNQTHVEHQVTIFHPDARGKGYHDDYAVMANKAWFLYNEGETSTWYTPKGQTSYFVDDPNKEVYKSRDDRIDRVDYIKNTLTKAEWLAWMDLPANQAQRDDTFTVKRYFEI